MYNWSRQGGRLRTTFEAQFTDTISLAPISVWMNSWQLSQAHAGMSSKPAKYDIKIWCDCNIPVAYTQLKNIIHTLLAWLVQVLRQKNQYSHFFYCCADQQMNIGLCIWFAS